MLIVEICKEYGLTYDEYIDQPNWFIELVKIKMRIDNEKAIREARKARQS